MHDHELPIDRALVRGLITDQFPEYADLPLRRVRSIGTDNALYRLGSDLVVRLPRTPWSSAEAADQREETWLPRLAPHLPVPTPVPVAIGRPGQGYPWRWSVSPWLRGKNPVVGQLAYPDRLARDLAAFVSALHAIALPGGPEASRGGPLLERDSETRAAIAALGEEIDQAAVSGLWESLLRAPAWTGPPVWLHGDLSPGNVLVRRGRLSAVIDFGMLGMGDPAVDLIVAWNLLPALSREVFCTLLGVDDATWARGEGWALSVALIQLPYYRVRNPELADSARRVICELLAQRHRRPGVT